MKKKLVVTIMENIVLLIMAVFAAIAALLDNWQSKAIRAQIAANNAKIAKNEAQMDRNRKLIDISERQIAVINEELARIEVEDDEYDEAAGMERYHRQKVAFEAERQKAQTEYQNQFPAVREMIETKELF
jgi:Tfp pilus assembly protein PilE